MNRVLKFRWWNGQRMIPHESLMVGVKNLKSPEHMQFVGLTDTNGVEIYEGDIMEENGGAKFEVTWDSKWAKFKLKSIGNIQYPEWNRGAKMAVIGNIFETNI